MRKNWLVFHHEICLIVSLRQITVALLNLVYLYRDWAVVSLPIGYTGGHHIGKSLTFGVCF